MKYFLIINNTRHRVYKDLWDKVDEKDKVEFHYAPQSKELFAIKNI